MEAIAEKLYTIEEYFAFCEKNEGLYEFVNGEIIEMAGETITSNLIAGNIHFFLKAFLKNMPFLVLQSVVRIMVEDNKRYRLPDVMVINSAGNHVKYATEAALIVEVTSDSTEDIDRREKLIEYCQLDSLQYYLIVAQDAELVELYRRTDDNGWKFEFYTKRIDVISLPYFNATLPLETIYENVVVGT